MAIGQFMGSTAYVAGGPAPMTMQFLCGTLNTSPYLTLYTMTSGAPVGVSHAPLGVSTINDMSFSPSGKYLLTAQQGSGMRILDWSGASPVVLTNPTTMPNGNGQGAFWGATDDIYTVGSTTSPNPNNYSFDGVNSTRITDPATLAAGTNSKGSFTPDGLIQAIPTSTTPFIAFYSWATSSPVRLSNPATIPTGTAQFAAFSPDGRYCLVGRFASFMIYDLQTGSPVLLHDIAVTGVSTMRRGSWHPDGEYFSIVSNNSPYIHTWRMVGGGTPVKQANPATLPAGTGQSCAYSPDGNYLAVGHASTPFMSLYSFSAGSLTKLANPAVLPTNAVLSISWRYV